MKTCYAGKQGGESSGNRKGKAGSHHVGKQRSAVACICEKFSSTKEGQRVGSKAKIAARTRAKCCMRPKVDSAGVALIGSVVGEGRGGFSQEG